MVYYTDGKAYKCTTANKDATFTGAKWSEITTVTGLTLLDNWDVINISNPIKYKPRSVCIGGIFETENYSTITNPTHVSWDYLNGSIRILYIAGLKPSKKYQISLLVF